MDPQRFEKNSDVSTDERVLDVYELVKKLAKKLDKKGHMMPTLTSRPDHPPRKPPGPGSKMTLVALVRLAHYGPKMTCPKLPAFGFASCRASVSFREAALVVPCVRAPTSVCPKRRSSRPSRRSLGRFKGPTSE